MELLISPLLFFDPEGKRQPRLSRTDNTTERERRLFCARCRHAITHQRQQIAVNGAYAHTRTNPHGIAFHIGCYREAPGCTALGAATTEFTWFPGYAWRIAECAKCSAHLGWAFTSSADAFFGLIVNRLTSELE